MAGDDATIALCGPCRHFLMAFSPPHGCALGLPVMDGAARATCASFHPFTKGEGSMFEQSDCCAHAAEEGHAH